MAIGAFIFVRTWPQFFGVLPSLVCVSHMKRCTQGYNTIWIMIKTNLDCKFSIVIQTYKYRCLNGMLFYAFSTHQIQFAICFFFKIYLFCDISSLLFSSSFMQSTLPLSKIHNFSVKCLIAFSSIDILHYCAVSRIMKSYFDKNSYVLWSASFLFCLFQSFAYRAMMLPQSLHNILYSQI